MFDGSVARESLRLWALWTKRRAVAHGEGAGQKPPLSTGSVQEEVTVFICYFENRKYNRRPSAARATGHCEESHHGGVLQLTPVERIPGWQSERPLQLQTAADSARGSRASLRKAASLAEALERRSLRELNQTEPIGSDVSSPKTLQLSSPRGSTSITRIELGENSTPVALRALARTWLRRLWFKHWAVGASPPSGAFNFGALKNFRPGDLGGNRAKRQQQRPNTDRLPRSKAKYQE